MEGSGSGVRGFEGPDVACRGVAANVMYGNW